MDQLIIVSILLIVYFFLFIYFISLDEKVMMDNCI